MYIYIYTYIYIYIYTHTHTHTHTHIEQRCCMLALSAMHHKHAPVAIRRTAWRVGRAFIRGGVKKKRNMRVSYLLLGHSPPTAGSSLQCLCCAWDVEHMPAF